MGSKFRSFRSQSIRTKIYTQNVHYDGCIFLCRMDRMKIKHTNQLEIAQNEIWTSQKFPAIWYVIVCTYAMGTGTHRSGNHLQQQLLVLEVHCSYLKPKYSRSMNIINAEKDFL